MTLFDLGSYLSTDTMGRYWKSGYNLKIPDSYKTENFRLRFRLKSDASVNDTGWLIDNVGIGKANDQYAYRSGTSMSTAQVTGAVALRASECRKDSADDIKQEILNSVDKLSDLTGKVVTEGRLNVNNLITADCKVKEDAPIAPILYLLF